MQKTTKEKQAKAESKKENKSYSIKSNLELVFPIILKQRELHESKHVLEECRCLKI